MKITFLGAAQEVTGSRYFVEHEDLKILVDCGLFQGKDAGKRNAEKLLVDPHTIDAVVLTHAHIDHTGYVPALVKNGFSGPVYCTPATFELCKILLVDSGFIQEENAKKRNENARSSRDLVTPLYNKSDAEYALGFFKVIDFDAPFTVGQSLQVTFRHAGHILGASSVVLSDGKKTVTFSGDLGRPQQMLMKAPASLQQTDFLILESTYGNTVHEEGDSIELLGKLVNQVAKRSGMLIIPVFAVGRAQMILYSLYQLKQKNSIPDIPIFLDSPMAIATTDLFCDFPQEHTLQLSLCQQVFDVATYTPTVQDSKKIDQITSPAIIITGSGMADGGRALYHFKHFISDEKNMIIFVGFQAVGTPGRDLVDGVKTIKIDDTWYDVRAQIHLLDTFSAHADSVEIVQWLASCEKRAPEKIFLTHGELESSQALKKKIEEHFGWSNVIIPKYGESFDLDV